MGSAAGTARKRSQVSLTGNGWVKHPSNLADPIRRGGTGGRVPQGNDVPFVRFPRWRVCPRCNRLSNQFRWPKGDPDLPPVPHCDECNMPTYPAMIVVACARGHIDDFPWYRWVHRGQNCGGGTLFLKGEGKSAALGDLRVECSCGQSRTLSGALGREAMAEAHCACQGRRPWLDDEKEDCTERLYALQRGASNIYFSVIRSALSIPPWRTSARESSCA